MQPCQRVPGRGFRRVASENGRRRAQAAAAADLSPPRRAAAAPSGSARPAGAADRSCAGRGFCRETSCNGTRRPVEAEAEGGLISRRLQARRGIASLASRTRLPGQSHCFSLVAARRTPFPDPHSGSRHSLVVGSRCLSSFPRWPDPVETDGASRRTSDRFPADGDGAGEDFVVDVADSEASSPSWPPEYSGSDGVVALEKHLNTVAAATALPSTGSAVVPIRTLGGRTPFALYVALFTSAPQLFTHSLLLKCLSFLPLTAAPGRLRSEASRRVLEDVLAIGLKPSLADLNGVIAHGCSARDPQTMFAALEACKVLGYNVDDLDRGPAQKLASDLGLLGVPAADRDILLFATFYLAALRNNGALFARAAATFDPRVRLFSDAGILLQLRRGLSNAAVNRFHDLRLDPKHVYWPLAARFALLAAAELGSPVSARTVRTRAPPGDGLPGGRAADASLELRSLAMAGWVHGAKQVLLGLESPVGEDLAEMFLAYAREGRMKPALDYCEVLAGDQSAGEAWMAPLAAMLALHAPRVRYPDPDSMRADAPTLLGALCGAAGEEPRDWTALAMLLARKEKGPVPADTSARMVQAFLEERNGAGLTKWVAFCEARARGTDPDVLSTVAAARPPVRIPDTEGWNLALRFAIWDQAGDTYDRTVAAMDRRGVQWDQRTTSLLIQTHAQTRLAGDARKAYAAAMERGGVSLPNSKATSAVLRLAVEDARRTGRWEVAGRWWREVARQGHLFNAEELARLAEGIEEIVTGRRPDDFERPGAGGDGGGRALTRPRRGNFSALGDPGAVSPSVPPPTPTRSLTATETLFTSILSIVSPTFPDSLPDVLDTLGNAVLGAYRGTPQEDNSRRFLASLDRITRWVREGPKVGDPFQVRTEAWKRDWVVRTLVPAILDGLGLNARFAIPGKEAPSGGGYRIADGVAEAWRAVSSDPSVMRWDVREFYRSKRDLDAWREHSAGKETGETAATRVREAYARLLVHRRRYDEARALLADGAADPAQLRRERALYWHFLSRARDHTVLAVAATADRLMPTTKGHGIPRGLRPLAATSQPHEDALAREWCAAGEALGWQGRVLGVLGRPAVDRARGEEWILAPAHDGDFRGVFALVPK